MKEQRLGSFVFILFAFLAFSACGVQPQQTVEPLDTAALYTQAAQTVISQLTRSAASTPQAPPEASQPSATAANPPAPLPTDTPAPTDTPQPTATPEPTFTPIPLPTFTPTITPIPCDLAEFVSDVTIRDNTVLTPGVSFIKTWRLRNIGACTWTPEYRLVFIDGFLLDGRTSIPLPAYVQPGQTVDISAELTAPGYAGTFRGDWLLLSADGYFFGIDPAGEKPFRTVVTVVEPGSDSTYDFVANYCAADWRSGAGLLPCPGDAGVDVGFVRYIAYPALESRQEDEPALWVHPNNQQNGWISGTYPPVLIRSGDRFKAEIGCLEASDGCQVTFQLDYAVNNGPVRNLGLWWESYDGIQTIIDLDLSSLAGSSVQFTFSVMVQGDRPQAANAFWLVPHIER